jgi:hypothetical protein
MRVKYDKVSFYGTFQLSVVSSICIVFGLNYVYYLLLNYVCKRVS